MTVRLLYLLFALMSFCPSNGHSTDINGNQPATSCDLEQMDMAIERRISGPNRFEAVMEDNIIFGSELNSKLSAVCSEYPSKHLCLLNTTASCPNYESSAFSNVRRGNKLCNGSVPLDWLQSVSCCWWMNTDNLL